MKVVLPKWSKIINRAFIPLVDNQDRVLILKGGRGSSKSDFAAKKLIKRCLSEPFFRFVLYRKTYNTIKDSQYQNIKDIIVDWGLESLFTFTTNPLQITCMNGNKFLCRGGDNPLSLKSLKDPTGVWYEEEIPDEGDFITISSSIRTQKASYLQELFSINPEVQGSFKEHWFWRRFFGIEVAKDQWEFKHPDGSNFRDVTVIKLPTDPLLGLPERDFEMTYTVHHSTHQDNKWLPDTFRAMLYDLERTNPYYYTVYCLGLWGMKETGGNFYKLFQAGRIVKPCKYNPRLPLHITFDFNVQPYVTLNVHQLEGSSGRWIARQVDEICLQYPRNRTAESCKEFKERYKAHLAGVFIYGDPAGEHEDTRTEQGYNDFIIILKELSTFRPQLRNRDSAPPVVLRGQFINDIFQHNEQGIAIEIDPRCVNTINDYQFLKEDAAGKKAKQRVKNSSGISYELYGHTSDANDYFYCTAFIREFQAYQRASVATRGHKTGKSTSANSY